MGDSGGGPVDAVAAAAAVAQDLPGLHDGEGVLDAGSDAAVVGVVAFLPAGQFGLPWLAAVRDQQSSALVAAVRKHGCVGIPGSDLLPRAVHPLALLRVAGCLFDL